MPTIAAYADHPTRPYIRVQVNWSDLPGVEYARVLRVDTTDGTCTPLRPYVCYYGDYLLLSCGHGTFWDTEVPLGHEVYYVTEGLDAPCLEAEPILSDTFTRTVTLTLQDTFTRTEVDTWGNATPTGQAWTNSGGAAADYDVAAGVGTASAGAVNSSRFTTLASFSLADLELGAQISIPVVATGADISDGLRLRSPDTNNYYYIEVQRQTGGTIRLQLVSRVAAVSTTIAGPVTRGTYTAGDNWQIRSRVVGSILQAKLWPANTPEPLLWDLEVVTTSLPAAGPVGTRHILSTGNTNPLPVVASWDNIYGYPVATGWDVSSSGDAWTPSGGNAYEYTINNGYGSISLTSVNSSRRMLIGSGILDSDQTVKTTIPVVALTDSIDLALMARYTDSSNYYHAVLHFHADSTVDVRIRKQVGGVFTTLAISSLLPGVYAPGSQYYLRMETHGSSLKAMGWAANVPPPSDWQLEVTDTSLTAAGQLGVRANLQAANTNAFPVTPLFSEYEVSAPCSPCIPVSATDPTVQTIPQDGRFWLRNPTHPCDDRPVPLCQSTSPLLPDCDGDGGILFLGAGPSLYQSNSFALRPVNRTRNISVTRPRSDAASSLRLQSLTFDDRDDLLALAAPGTPLLWDGPPEYGVSRRYMDVLQVSETPELPDLRVSLRTFTLPYTVVDRPPGPTLGICGARVADICELYPTIDDAIAAGLTYDDFLTGRASPELANPDARTWAEVDTEFASFSAVNTDGRTFYGLEVGE